MMNPVHPHPRRLLILFTCCISFATFSQDLAFSGGKHPPEVPKQSGAQLKSLRSVLSELETRYKVHFAFEAELINNKSINAQPVDEGNLEKTLRTMLRPLQLRFKKIEKDVYVIQAADNRSESALTPLENRQVQPIAQPLNDNSALDNLAPRSEAIRSTGALVDVVVKGKVTDENGNELPGVSVLLKGTAVGTATNSDGTYSITTSDGNGTLVFSFIGYTTEEVVINNQTRIDLTLLPDIKSLSEVVVVGYGTEKRVTVTGAVSSLKGTEVMQSPATNVSNSLVGRVPGLVAITPSGEPGYDGATLRIRGVNSLGNNDPLVVVDGIPGRSLERIDPNSIESITVLKDASAAIYGAQAANGVILVTTKRGKTGKPTVTVNLNQGYGRPTRIPQMANAPEYATMLNEIDLYKGQSPRFTAEEIQKFGNGSDPWKYPNTDWFGQVLKPWSGQNYGNVTVSGGSENMKYFLSLGAKSQDGYYKNSATKYTQYDFRSNLDGKISKNVNIGFDLAGRQENRNFPTRSAQSIFRMVMRGKPTLPAYWPDGTPGPDIEYGDNPVVVSTDATGYDKDKWYILQSNLRLNINIPWVKGLSFTANGSLDKGFRFHKRFETPWYLYSWDGQSYDANGKPVLIKGKKGFDDPRLSEDTEDKQDILGNARFDYERSIADVHNFKFMVGAERRSGNRDLFSAYRRFFVSTSVDQLFAGGDDQKNNGGTAYQTARQNYFGRVNYNYREKYLVEFVWRYDGSYIFPASKRFGFFPGISAGWRLSEEAFFKNGLPFVDNFKLRASWGQTGNDRIDEYQYLSSYGFGSLNYIFGIDKENKTLYETRIPNKNVTWEVANQANVGFETQLFHNKLSIEFDYFNNTRSSILWWRNASTPSSAGLTLPRENIGKVVNKGVDFSVSYRDEIGKFKYQVGVNGGYQRNKIAFWDESPGRPAYQQSTGHPIPTDPYNSDGSLYYQAIGIFKDADALSQYPHWDGARPGDVIFQDVNNDGKIDANDKVRNNKTDIPRFTGGMSLNLQYGQFDLSILFQAATGAVRYIYTESGEIGNYLKDYYDNRWTVDNPNASYPRSFNRDNEYWRNNSNTFWLHKTDYLRLKNLQFGYNLPSGVTKRLGIQGLRVYVSGLNIFTYTPYLKDFDPESNRSDGQSYPLQKVLNGGLTLTF